MQSRRKPPAVETERLIKDKKPLPARMIVTSDTHFPIEDKYYVNALMQFAQYYQPDTWIVLGDLYEFWGLSTFPKEPERWFNNGQLQRELDSAQDFWSEVCSISNRVEFVLGNHEGRLGRTITNNPSLFGLRAFDFGRLAEIPEKVTVHQYGSRITVGGLVFEHGDRIGTKQSKYLAEWALTNRVGQSTFFGHFHTIQTAYKTVFTVDDGPKIYMAHCLGHGSNVSEQKYALPSPNWQHGFGVFEFYTVNRKPRYTFTPIHVVDGRFMYDGKLFDGHRS